jgi:signal transduction histidine kinase
VAGFDPIVSWAVGAVVAAAVLVAARAVFVARAARKATARAEMIKDQFVSMVSHELRTPLTSIAGFADTLIADWHELSPDDVDEFLRIIRLQAHHLGELIEDVLVIPRLDAGRIDLKMGYFDVSELCQEVSDMVVGAVDDHRVTISVPTGSLAFGDRNRTYQVLRHLVDNARKYGGGEILIAGMPYADKYMFTVDDNGPGIPHQARERIFEHFEQMTKGDNRRDQGVGLGLPIARRLARAMGGDVWLEPRFPTGSRFAFTIHLRNPEEVLANRLAAEAAEREAAKAGSRRRPASVPSETVPDATSRATTPSEHGR